VTLFESLGALATASGEGAVDWDAVSAAARASTDAGALDVGPAERAGFADMSDEESIRYCEGVFAPDLAGHGLFGNNSFWRTFPIVHNERWFADNVVLIGDALRTAHFSLGSGTRLAMEDGIALARALREAAYEVPAAFVRFEEIRRAPMETLFRAANASLRWYEEMGERMHLAPYDFAHAYMVRTGRVSDDKLARVAPRFMERYRAQGEA